MKCLACVCDLQRVPTVRLLPGALALLLLLSFMQSLYNKGLRVVLLYIVVKNSIEKY